MTDTPRTPRTLPTREQIAEVVGYVLRDTGNYPRAAQAAMVSRDITHLRDTIVDAVLARIDKENTMPDDTIPVPRALIDSAAEVLDGLGDFPELTATLYALLDPPKPPAPRLRVVNLDDIRIKDIEDMGERFLSADDIEAQPDVQTVIDETVYEWARSSRSPSQTWGEFVDDLLARIHAVFGVES